ncbi:Zn2Cys6 transcription factor [Aspergillus niger]|uniref:uncharacterized protein n=1 Tax=Aspergillus lacticoffeatus (strain CBS 101883) TaxID=1450533 RepID=UPI000D7FEA96|nr:uncharacterized protein BO96DRAFT_415121 [Aspergillus niger CBS 101883]KAI2883482.1 transcriptional regulator family: Fungal Specific TF [Aspergillus niger]PYH52909.1 hypothetical protein BO96DRAFT_415121 [Aspergillus niger CBS 101883]GJP92881.1 Zn2Cys6 transcription factor [Aspergillus niger]
MSPVSGQISPPTELAGDASLTRKRPRPVVSCLRCRKKKLKCDRVMPCENCSKAGCAPDCVFHPSPDGVDNVPDQPSAKRMHLPPDFPFPSDPRGDPASARLPPPPAAIGLLEDLQQRLQRVEEVLSLKPLTRSYAGSLKDVVARDASPSVRQTTPSTHAPPYPGTLVVKGKGTRSRYHGQNNRTTLLHQFSEAREFIERCTKDSAILGLAKEVQFLQSKSKMPMSSPESMPDLDYSPELLQMQSSLPSKAVCDRLVNLYTTNFERTLRMLHVPSFLRQYADFWNAPGPDAERSAAFLPQLTAVLAAALPLEDPSFRLEYSSVWEYLQTPAVNLVRVWLQKLGRKQRTELVSLQIEALVLLARRLRLASQEELWRATGTLVRSAMVVGLHLDLSGNKQLSPFQIEVRRRLWITIVEMDLQTSIASGMPVTIPDLDFDPLIPTNLNDTDFDESTTELPPAKPLHEWTDTLAQVTLASSLPHRIRAMSMVRTSSPGMDLRDIVKQGRRLEECLRQIPPPLKLDPSPIHGETPGPALLLNRVLLDVYMRRPLLCLYRPIVMGESREDQLFLEIEQACLESSLVVLSYQDYFDPNVADLDVFKSTAYWDVFQLFCKNDIPWAALSVCGYMKLSNQQHSGAPTPMAPAPAYSPSQPTTTHTKASLTRIVENTLDGLTRTIGETGSNIKDVMLLAVVLQSVRARGSAELKERWMQQGAVKALSACRQHLLPSVAQQSFAFNLTDFAQMLQTTQPIFPTTTDPGYTPSTQPQLPDFLAESSALATEFNNFRGDPFAFEDGSFAWNM